LIKSFQHLYDENIKAIYVLDQAPFHVMYQGFPPSNVSKKEIVKYYDEYNINDITIQRVDDDDFQGQTLRFHRESFLRKKSNMHPEKGGPSKWELYLYLYFYLKKNNPDALQTKISQIASKFGHLVLYTCPYSPQYQPAEYLNAHVKFMVKKKCKKHRTILELKNDIRDGLYGGITSCGRIHSGIDARIIDGWIRNCHSNMDHDIQFVLNFKDKNIHNLWTQNCEYSVTTQKQIKIPQMCENIVVKIGGEIFNE